jgi:hypothetical protein
MIPVTVSVSDASAGAKYSSWVRFDSWALPNVSVQINKSGTVNYTLETTMDDPNSPTDAVAVNDVTWFNSTDANVVGATAAKQTSFTSLIPTFARIKLNSGSGSVTATFVQAGNVTF